MAPIKPKHVFADQWFLITYYNAYEPTDNIHRLPEHFGNVGTAGTIDVSKEENIHALIKEEFMDFFGEYPQDYLYGRDATLYYIPCKDGDECIEISDLIDSLGDDEGIGVNAFNFLSSKLAQQKPVTFKIYAIKPTTDME